MVVSNSITLIEIVITATGTANLKSKPAEVWIYEFGGPDVPTRIKHGEYGEGWEIRENLMVSYKSGRKI